MQTQINPELKNFLFENLEQTEENLKGDIEDFVILAKKKIESQLNRVRFEAAYGLSLSKKQREKTMQEVKEVRAELWKEALEKANGDTKKAYAFYKSSCSFS